MVFYENDYSITFLNMRMRLIELPKWMLDYFRSSIVGFMPNLSVNNFEKYSGFSKEI